MAIALREVYTRVTGLLGRGTGVPPKPVLPAIIINPPTRDLRFHPSMLRPLICSALSLALVSFTSLAPCGTAQAGTFNWANVTGPWSTPENWTPAGPPTGTDPTDILVFGGDVGSIAGSAPNYTSTNDISVTPFVLNGITLQATDINNQPTDPPLIIAGSRCSLRVPLQRCCRTEPGRSHLIPKSASRADSPSPAMERVR
jgi:hypothetical protein